MIEVKNITKVFGPIKAVDNVSFNVEKGEVLGFLGPNGAGKSTTLRIIAGYLPPNEGTVKIDGKEFWEDQIGAKGKIGYMPESTPLYKEMTPYEYLSFLAEIHGLEDIGQKVEKVFKLANLDSIRNQLIGTISKGFRSRLIFAGAIIHDPPILLLDEPTDGLDPNQKNEIRGLIKSLSKEKAIIVSTHILEEVDAMCSRVIIISEGHLVLDGTPQDLRNASEKNNRIIVSLRSEDKAKVSELLSSVLIPVAGGSEQFERYRIENSELISDIQSKLSNAGIVFKELYYYNTPLDEAFSKLTISKE